VGVFLLLFGLKWLHKAILRSSGIKSLHDEAKIFEETKEMLESAPEAPSGLDRVGVTPWGVSSSRAWKSSSSWWHSVVSRTSHRR
jgi:hypothetical protein